MFEVQDVSSLQDIYGDQTYANSSEGALICNMQWNTVGHARHTKSRTVTSSAEAQIANSAVTTLKPVATCCQISALGVPSNMLQVAQHGKLQQ
jgi:hypothetical protein